MGKIQNIFATHTSDNLPIKLNQDEVLFLVRILNLPDLPGFNDRPWGDVSIQTAKRIYQSAGRSLLARNAITIGGDEKILVGKDIEEVLSVCALPDKLNAIMFEAKKQTKQIFHYRSIRFDIRHTFDSYGVHTFEKIIKSDMGQTDARSFLGNANFSQTSKAMEIDEDLLEKIVKVSPSDPGMPPDVVAKEIFDVLVGFDKRIYIQAIYQLNPTLRQNEISLFTDLKSCVFVEHIISRDRRRVKIMMINKKTVDQILSSTFASYQFDPV